MRVLLATGSLFEKASGPYPCVRGTARALGARGHKVGVVGTRRGGESDAWIDWGEGVEVHAFRAIGPYSLHFAPFLDGWLKGCSPSPDVVSLHGLWLWGHGTIADWCRERGVPYMLTLHGTLNEYALRRSRWKKLLARYLFVDRMLKGAHCLRVLNKRELEAARAFGVDKPLALIPNGISVPSRKLVTSGSASRQVRTRTCLYLGRLHPIKGLDLLIEAWAQVRPEGWQLVIAGGGKNAFVSRIKKMVVEHSLEGQVEFIGYVYSQEKRKVIRNADLYVLPSRSEGLPMTPLEVMIENVPILITDASNLGLAEEAGVAAVVNAEVEDLAGGLQDLTQRSEEELREMGAGGREFVRNHYSWRSVIVKLEEVYGWMTGTNTKPDCLITD